ncbi:MAG: hypothetical protein HUK13_02735 [Muribaculaceae bacterium]|nr:hypothetical protein [Muribaculaceae bacterium]
MKAYKLLALIALALSLGSCNHLTKEAKEMVGNYYIPEISEDVPIMELNGNGRCTIRAINPGVLTFSVEGKWNVVDDSLVTDLKRETLTYEGDSTLIGNVPEHVSSYIVDFNGMALTIKHPSGNHMVFHRRGAR